MAEGVFLDGVVRYPDDLPCPHADTDLTPRERRYISDIGEVKKLRRFQKTFQATRQNISFVFTPEQSRRFREWYKHEIIDGGAWFYADWPILHKEEGITYRFVTRPVWEFLARGNYHVSATVELYERKVVKTVNVYTSKIYPYYFKDALRYNYVSVRAMPEVDWEDKLSYEGITVTQGNYTKLIYSSYKMADEDVSYTGIHVTQGDYTKRIYSSYKMADEKLSYSGIVVPDVEITARLIKYDYFLKEDNSVVYGGIVVTAGETE